MSKKEKMNEGFDDIHDFSISGTEFVVSEDGYCLRGGHTTIIDLNSDLQCPWQENVRGDLCQTTQVMYQWINRDYTVRPAWRVLDNADVVNMLIDGQPVDEVIPITEDGKEFYLWIIYDLHTENNAKDIVITGE